MSLLSRECSFQIIKLISSSFDYSKGWGWIVSSYYIYGKTEWFLR